MLKSRCGSENEIHELSIREMSLLCPACRRLSFGGDGDSVVVADHGRYIWLRQDIRVECVAIV